VRGAKTADDALLTHPPVLDCRNGRRNGTKATLRNGPSSAGKSTLAGALAKTLGSGRGWAYRIVALDDSGNVPRRAHPGRTACSKRPATRSAIRQAAECGFGVIVDRCITSKRIYDAILGRFRPAGC